MHTYLCHCIFDNVCTASWKQLATGDTIEIGVITITIMHVCIHVCLFACMYVCYVCLFVCMYIYMNVYMKIYMYV